MPFQRPEPTFTWYTLERIGPGEPDKRDYYKSICGPAHDHAWDDPSITWSLRELASPHGIEEETIKQALVKLMDGTEPVEDGIMIHSRGVNFRLKVYQEQTVSGTRFKPAHIGFIVTGNEPEQGKYCVQAWIPDPNYYPDPQHVFKSESLVKSLEDWWGDGVHHEDYQCNSQLRFPRAYLDTTPLITICESLEDAMALAETMLQSGPQGELYPWEYSSSKQTCVRGTGRPGADPLIAMVVTIQFRWIGKATRELRAIPSEELEANLIPTINPSSQ